MRAIFVDKDGTLIEDVPYNVNPALIRLAAHAVAALRRLQQHGYLLFVVSNQSGVGRGLFDESALAAVERRLESLLGEGGVTLSGFFYCPHFPDSTQPRYAIRCDCRKPEPGMLTRAAERFRIDLSRSWMIGDILDDVECGHRAGCRTVLIDNGNETEWKMSASRRPDVTAPDLLSAAQAILAEEAQRARR